ncbi:MAG: hypothetical protein CL928_06870 [Deltaproteobacteria bacterium]|nr:hypothetical protein [Deltaproteobacteria bacterium]
MRRSLDRRVVSGGLVLVMLAMTPWLSRCGNGAVSSQPLLEALNNTRPVARAGADGESPVGAPLVLDGASSYDPDGDEISYHWWVDTKPESSQLGDSPFSINGDRNAGLTTVVPDVEGVFIFALQVEDPDGVRSDTDWVIFRARSTLDLPIANAGTATSGLEGDELCLDGSASVDPNGLPLSFDWTLVAAPSASGVTTEDLDTAGASCCLEPDAPGAYTLALVVNNGLVDSEPDFAFITAGSTNEGPEAVAELVSAASCSFVTLTGENSTDPEDDTLYYDWDLLLVPASSGLILGEESFDDPTAQSPRFYADVPGSYKVQLVVNDGEHYSTPVFLDMDLDPAGASAPPEIVATEDAYFYSPSPVCSAGPYGGCDSCPNCPNEVIYLDAYGTTDPDGDPVEITWSIAAGPDSVNLAIDSGWETQLTMPGPAGSCPPVVTNTHEVQVQVTATDCGGAQSTQLLTFVYDCG